MDRKCENCSHSNCFINRYCSTEWKPLISFYKTSKIYPAGTVIFSEGDPVKGIYQVYSGKIKEIAFYGDKQHIVRLVKAEQMLGCRGIGDSMYYPVSAITLEDAQLTFIPIDIFYKTIKANPEFAFNMMLFYANELQYIEKLTKMRVSMTAREKVILSLIIIVNAFGFDRKDKKLLKFTPNRKDIASIAETTYETVIRALSTLDKLGVLELKGKSIRILDLNYLKQAIKWDK